MERQFWTPESEEEEPRIELKINGESAYELNRLNSTLYSFLGRLAVYNHVFYHGTEDEDSDKFYIFEYQKSFAPIAQYMAENDYPMILNQPEVSVTDQEAYMRSATRDLGNGLPEEWR